MVKNDKRNKRKTARPSPPSPPSPSKHNVHARSVYDVARQAYAVALDDGNPVVRKEFYDKECCAPLLQALFEADNFYDSMTAASSSECMIMELEKLMSLSGVHFCLLYYLHRAGMLRDAFLSWPENIRRYVLVFKTQLKCTAFYIKSSGANVAKLFLENCCIKEDFFKPFSWEDIQHRHDLSASMLELGCSDCAPNICSGLGMLVDMSRRSIYSDAQIYVNLSNWFMHYGLLDMVRPLLNVVVTTRKTYKTPAARRTVYADITSFSVVMLFLRTFRAKHVRSDAELKLRLLDGPARIGLYHVLRLLLTDGVPDDTDAIYWAAFSVARVHLWAVMEMLLSTDASVCARAREIVNKIHRRHMQTYITYAIQYMIACLHKTSKHSLDVRRKIYSVFTDELFIVAKVFWPELSGNAERMYHDVYVPCVSFISSCTATSLNQNRSFLYSGLVVLVNNGTTLNDVVRRSRAGVLAFADEKTTAFSRLACCTK